MDSNVGSYLMARIAFIGFLLCEFAYLRSKKPIIVALHDLYSVGGFFNIEKG